MQAGMASFADIVCSRACRAHPEHLQESPGVSVLDAENGTLREGLPPEEEEQAAEAHGMLAPLLGELQMGDTLCKGLAKRGLGARLRPAAAAIWQARRRGHGVTHHTEVENHDVGVVGVGTTESQHGHVGGVPEEQAIDEFMDIVSAYHEELLTALSDGSLHCGENPFVERFVKSSMWIGHSAAAATTPAGNNDS